MSKRQANLIIALLVAVVSLQVIFGALTLRGQERIRKSAEAAEMSSSDAMDAAIAAKNGTLDRTAGR